MRGIADVGLVHNRASTNSSSVVLYILTIYAGDLDKRDISKRLCLHIIWLCHQLEGDVTVHWQLLCLLQRQSICMVVTKIVKETFWLKDLVDYLGLQQGDAIVFCYGKSAIHLTFSQMFHERIKHIDVIYHLICEIVSKGIIAVINVATLDNPTTMMIKPDPLNKFKNCLDLVGVLVGVCSLW